MNLETCIAHIMGRRWLTILLSAVVVLALTAGAMYIVQVDVDFRNHFGKDDPRLVALEQLEDTYSISDTALVAVAPQKGTIFTREALVAIEEMTEQLWRTPYVTRVDSIANYSHSEGFEDELVVESLIDDASSLSDSDIERIERIALGTEEVSGRLRFPGRSRCRIGCQYRSSRGSRGSTTGKSRGCRFPQRHCRRGSGEVFDHRLPSLPASSPSIVPFATRSTKISASSDPSRSGQCCSSPCFCYARYGEWLRSF